MTLKIIGGGLAGLLAANLLHRYDPEIIESQDHIPNNHSAVLRFRSPLVSEALGIPFKKVKVIKAVLPWLNPVADALAYSDKSTGVYRSDRSINYGSEIVDRYIAPPDLIPRMATRVKIRLNSDWSFDTDEKVISTIPMPSLMKCLGYPHMPDFSWRGGVNVKAKIDRCDAYVSIAVPDPAHGFNRVSITGDELIVECPRMSKVLGVQAEVIAGMAASLMGIDRNRLRNISWHEQKYAKINPIPENTRKGFIFWASVTKGKAFSLGRFATWRPGLLLDDLVNDIRLIGNWIENGVPGADKHNDLHYVTEK